MKNFVKYILLFVIYFCAISFFFYAFRMDTYSNYGFSYGLINGSIPYKDINMVVPIFSPFIYSLFLIYSQSILCFYLGQAFLLTLMSYFLFKLFDKRAYLIILSLFIPIGIPTLYVIFPGYNFIVLLLLIILLYLEKSKCNDYLIGIILGLFVITKQNVGVFILLIGILYNFKNFKKMFIRFIFSLIPISIFILYLVFNNILFDFYNYCFLGLREFSNNIYIEYQYLFCLVLVILFVIKNLIKYKNFNISYLYLLVYLIVIYPIFDGYHFSLFFIFSLIVILYNSDFKVSKYINYICFGFILVMTIFWRVLCNNYFSNFNFYSYNNFPFEVLSSDNNKSLKKVINYTKDFNNVIVIGNPNLATFYYSSTNRDINKYLVLFRGNYGKDGTNYIFNSIKNESDTYFIVDTNSFCSTSYCQYLDFIPKYIMDNYDLIKRFNNYYVYYK